ncbi:MAG: hypothetical protein N2449_06495 [Bacteroidales bacterium]|nr:hypothetical protein [Bacteroidales bacterium]
MIKRFFLWFILCNTASVLIAQSNLHQEVSVVKPYEPTIADAFKINIMPNIVDTNKILSKFDYKLFPKLFPVYYQVTPIQPAKMTAESINKLYQGNVKFGYGIYNTLIGQVSWNTTRNRDFTAGIWANHYSSRGKIKLANDYRSPAFLSQNQVEIYGKKFISKATFYGNAYFNRNVFHLYGYNVADTTFDDTADSTRQRYVSFGTKLGYRTTHLDSSKINHQAELQYNYLEDKFSNFQHNIITTISGNMLYGKQFVGADVKINWNNINTKLDTNNKAIVTVFPWVRFFGDDWRINAGLAMEVDAYTDSTFYHFYPRANIQYNVIENFLIPFAGFDGKMIMNTLQTAILENPYIKPGSPLKNTNQLMNIFAGFKGNFSRNISYLFKVSYSLYDYLPFYINDTINPQHTFILKYDGVPGKETQEVCFTGELAYKNKEKLNIFLNGNYFKYTLVNLLQPYHKPLWETSLTARYNLSDKFIPQLSLFVVGERYAFNHIDPLHPIQLKPFVDVNFSLDYHYSKLFGAFIKFNNLLNKKYMYWNYYPVQRLQVLFGLSLTM